MEFTRQRIMSMLALRGEEARQMRERAHLARAERVGERLFLRGLIEYSNICAKNCFYCGIRRGMAGVERYTLTREQVVCAARGAVARGYGSVVIQAGESTGAEHVGRIERIVREVSAITPASAGVSPEESVGWAASPGITLSLGEQSPRTLRRWREAGAGRYLLRVESSDPGLYASIHPRDRLHDFKRRERALRDLRGEGYVVGTGVMIGLPGQDEGHLADDLIYMRDMNIDMCGMGPFIPCAGTPLAVAAVPSVRERVELTLNMTAVLRLMMPDINIAATTALETLSRGARAEALRSGANVAMINLTPSQEGASYGLYDNKPRPGEMSDAGLDFLPGTKGDPRHFTKSLKNEE